MSITIKEQGSAGHATWLLDIKVMQDMLVQPWLLNIGGSAGYASTAMIIKYQGSAGYALELKKYNNDIKEQRRSGYMIPINVWLSFWTEMQKAADAADISVLFVSAGANFWAVLGHFWAILAMLGHFWANLGNIG